MITINYPGLACLLVIAFLIGVMFGYMGRDAKGDREVNEKLDKIKDNVWDNYKNIMTVYTQVYSLVESQTRYTKAHWEPKLDEDWKTTYRCSNCGKVVDKPVAECPGCGAKMRKKNA